MTVGGLVDTVSSFNRLCECHLYTAPRNKYPDELSLPFSLLAPQPVDYKIRNFRALQLSADSKIEANSTGAYKSAYLLEAYRSPALEIT